MMTKINNMYIPTGCHKDKIIFIGADHRGYEYKNKIIKLLQCDYNLTDIGTFSPERCDYPVISDDMGKMLADDPYSTAGIGICGTGMGILIPASKYRGVYAARCITPEEAAITRKHNNTNMLGIGADTLGLETAIEIITTWLETPFYADPATDERYMTRFIQTIRLENEAFSPALSFPLPAE